MVRDCASARRPLPDFVCEMIQIHGYFAPLLAFGVALALLPMLIKGWLLPTVLDQPNERSLHSDPRPRSGGIAVFAGALSGWVLLIPFPGRLAAAAGVLMLVSWIDDVRGLSPTFRLMLHIAMAAAFVVSELKGVGIVGLILSVLAIVWGTNLYNFMDGTDGLAGGMAIFGFGWYGMAAWMAGNPVLALACLCVVASATAFLFFNFPPARIFMGDCGSIPLGFLAAAMGLSGWHSGTWPVWVPALIFSPFVLDATLTLIRRAAYGHRVWEAHRDHYYQRLVLSGWTHKQLAASAYGLMIACGASAVWAGNRPGSVQAAVVVVWVVAYLGLIAAIGGRTRARTTADGDAVGEPYGDGEFVGWRGAPGGYNVRGKERETSGLLSPQTARTGP